MTPATDTRAPLVPRTLLGEQVAFAGLLWLLMLAAAGLLIAAVAYWSDVSGSAWDGIASQIPRWWVLFLCAWAAGTMLPLYIAHGVTRRDLARQGTVFVVLYAAALALMAVIGYGLEAVVYAIADWPQDVRDRALVGSATAYPLIFIEYWLAFAVWGAAGAFAGLIFYRYEREAGLAAVLLLAVPVTIVEVALGSDLGAAGRFLLRPLSDGDFPAALAVVAALIALALALALSWPVLRDLPLRPRGA